MGARKLQGSWRVEGALTYDGADETFSSAMSVGGRLTASTGIAVGAAELVNVVSQPSTVEATPLTGTGGMAVIGSTSTLVYQLPISTAGSVYYVFWSSGASAILSPIDTTNTKIAGPGGTAVTTITGSTGDHCLVIAQSSSQWNLLSHSSNITSS